MPRNNKGKSSSNESTKSDSKNESSKSESKSSESTKQDAKNDKSTDSKSEKISGTNSPVVTSNSSDESKGAAAAIAAVSSKEKVQEMLGELLTNVKEIQVRAVYNFRQISILHIKNPFLILFNTILDTCYHL